jgi:hypothetical protein
MLTCKARLAYQEQDFSSHYPITMPQLAGRLSISDGLNRASRLMASAK